MYHFFVKPSDIIDDKVTITGDDFNHIKNVLRMKIGDEVSISTGEDWNYLCTISQMANAHILLDIKKENESISELPARIVLCQGLPKSDKMELIIQKAVELGVSQIVPVITERTIVKLDEKKSKTRTDRWNSISHTAAKQSKRGIIPIVSTPMSFRDSLSYLSDADIKLIPYEMARHDMKSTVDLIQSIKSSMTVAIWIGPEGGFTDEEIEVARQAGTKPITLGCRILRTETAGLVALSLVMVHLESLYDINFTRSIDERDLF